MKMKKEKKKKKKKKKLKKKLVTRFVKYSVVPFIVKKLL